MIFLNSLRGDASVSILYINNLANGMEYLSFRTSNSDEILRKKSQEQEGLS